MSGINDYLSSFNNLLPSSVNNSNGSTNLSTDSLLFLNQNSGNKSTNSYTTISDIDEYMKEFFNGFESYDTCNPIFLYEKYTKEVVNARNLVRNNSDKIHEYWGNGQRLGGVADGDFAIDFFNQIQLDNGILTPYGNGDNLSLSVLNNEIQEAERQLKNATSAQKKELETTLAMLRGIKNANTNGDNVITAEEMQKLLRNNNGKMPLDYSTGRISTDKYTKEVDNGEQMIKNNRDSIHLKKDQWGRPVTGSVDADFATKFFNKMQLDDGILNSKNNGDDFSISVIDNELKEIDSQLAKASGQERENLLIEKAMLRAIKNANRNADGKVSAEEFQALLKAQGGKLRIHIEPVVTDQIYYHDSTSQATSIIV